MTTVRLTPRQTMVLATLREAEPITSPAIAKKLAYNKETVGSIMDRLVELGFAYATFERLNKSTKRVRMYHFGTNPDAFEPDDNPIFRPVVKVWPPHHVRDSLVAALFGAAAA